MTGPTFAAAHVPAVRHAPARSAPNARAALARPEVDAGGNRVLTYLRLHWLTILFLGSLIGAGLAYAAWVLVPPKYESYALFQVSSAPSLVSASGDPSRGRTEFNTYLKTTASLFKTEMVYTRALADLRDNATLAGQKDPVKFLDQELHVDTKEGSEIIRLSLKGVNPADVRGIVDAMKASYIAQIVDREWKQKSEQRAEMQQQATALGQLIKQKMGPGGVGGVPGGLPGAVDPNVKPAAVAALPGADPLPDPGFLQRARMPSLINEELKLRSELPAYDTEAERLKAGIAATKDALQRLLDDPASGDATEAAKKDDAYLRAVATAEAREAEYTSRAARVRDPNSATMTALKRAADAAREEANAILAAKAKSFEAEKRKPLFAKLSQEVTLAEVSLTQLARRKEVAVAALARVQKELRETPPPLIPASTVAAAAALPQKPPADPVVTDISTHDKMYERLTAHVIGLDMELKGPKRVTVLQSASVPQVVDAKKQLLATAAAGLMGFALVAGCVLLAETRARKVSSLGELKGTSATPVVGVVPWMPDGATARDPLKRADVNEAIDKLRAYVVQTWLSRGASTVTVTSALGDEGKAFTAFGLASSLAQAGYKTLLVDFDLRNPGLHSFAGVPNASGVCELLRGEADFRKTIQILPNGLHFLAAGKWSDDARQAAVGGRLEALLNRLKEPFDCVVLHGHALLTVAESVEVARRSEVVLLCALYRDTRGPMLKRATDRVASMEIPFAGIVYLGATPNEALC